MQKKKKEISGVFIKVVIPRHFGVEKKSGREK